jgi:coenzyme F420-reducing hydrogenase beta subunit
VKKSPKIFDEVVNQDLCIGCGVCVNQCPSGALKMVWNKIGFLVPDIVGNCDLNGLCLSVCPFNPAPQKEVKTEEEISDLFLDITPNHHPKIGKYFEIYTGFAKFYRLTSSSGGIATFIFSKLFEKKIIDYAVSVKESSETNTFYEYAIIKSKQELLSASKTKYFPVTLEKVLQEVNLLDGKVAIVGVACFIKAIRLAQFYNPLLKDKIPFLVGIICGGVKSRFFTEYLAFKAGVPRMRIKKPQFRVKDIQSNALDYSFGCYDIIERKEKKIKMKHLGDMWGTGLFKANACDFCDDVTTELADISLGDAWIEPYSLDGLGTNIVITRSKLADDLINKGFLEKEITINKLPVEQLILSQKGNFNHRQTGISVRIKIKNLFGKKIPPKRFSKKKVFFEFWVVQFFRMQLRKKSLKIWEKELPENFENYISPFRKRLAFATRVYHFVRKFRKNNFIK